MAIGTLVATGGLVGAVTLLIVGSPVLASVGGATFLASSVVNSFSASVDRNAKRVKF